MELLHSCFLSGSLMGLLLLYSSPVCFGLFDTTKRIFLKNYRIGDRVEMRSRQKSFIRESVAKTDFRFVSTSFCIEERAYLISHTVDYLIRFFLFNSIDSLLTLKLRMLWLKTSDRTSPNAIAPAIIMAWTA